MSIIKERLHVGRDFVDNVQTGTAFAPPASWVFLMPPRRGWVVSLDDALWDCHNSVRWSRSSFRMRVREADRLVLETDGGITLYGRDGQIASVVRKAESIGPVWDLVPTNGGDVVLYRDNKAVWSAIADIGGGNIRG